MNQRFSMLPGGGLYERYQWWRFRRSVRAACEAMEAFSAQVQRSVDVIREFAAKLPPELTD